MAKKKFDYMEVDEEMMKCHHSQKGSNIITCLARMSFPNIISPRPSKKGDNDSAKKYQLSLLIPPEFSIRLLEKDTQRAIEETWGEKPPKKLKMPVLEAGDFEYEGYEPGWRLIRVSAKRRPQIFDDVDKTNITEEDDQTIYPGRWCVATVRAYTYDVDGNRGVSFGLGNVVLRDHDDRLGGGGVSVADEFGIDEEYQNMRKGKKGAFNDDEDEDERPVKKKAPRRDEDDKDDRPRKKPVHRVVDDEDDERPVKKPVRRVIVDDEDDEDDRPRRKRRSDEDYD